MVTTAIFECYKCGGLLLGLTEQKTRTCPYCNNRINLSKAKKINTAKSAFQASEILQKLKKERQDNMPTRQRR